MMNSNLRDFIPAHEFAFQVMRGTDVAVNEYLFKELVDRGDLRLMGTGRSAHHKLGINSEKELV